MKSQKRKETSQTGKAETMKRIYGEYEAARVNDAMYDAGYRFKVKGDYEITEIPGWRWARGDDYTARVRFFKTERGAKRYAETVVYPFNHNIKAEVMKVEKAEVKTRKKG